MALDGIVIANMVCELKKNITNSRIYKIAQPESDELMLTFKGSNGQFRLTISANGGLPLIYFANENKPSPMVAPNFCMLLRKHLGNARLINITQPGLERIIKMSFEHLDEMGDLCQKHLVIELMGKHSNIILTDDNNTILDSIKHISCQVSSVREVLPQRPYFIPNTSNKLNPLELTKESFTTMLSNSPMPLGKAIYSNLTGISPIIAEEICYRAKADSNLSANAINNFEIDNLFTVLSALVADINAEKFTPLIVYKNQKATEFSSINLSLYKDDSAFSVECIDTCSHMLNDFYARKNADTRIKQKSSDLRKIITTLLERNYKKYDLQLRQLEDTKKRDKYRLYGELLNTYGYEITTGVKSYDALNYYNNETVTIPLDETLSAHENAVKYFDRYNKLKRTFEATTKLLEDTKDLLNHLESILNSLNIAENEEDLVQLKEEMIECGYIRRKGPSNKKIKITSKPFHYVSSDGFHMYVGKNNYQNEELTFKFANNGDWWFHTKKIPGSHVIVKTNGEELTDKTFEEAAGLAAYYSSGKSQDRIEIDYTQKKHLKKPAGSKPGFVIYHTNYSLVASPDISALKLVTD